jgi:hypothetical protein
MDSPPDNFESLEKLLKLKRYEQPPPRYFNRFSGQVLARIESGEGRTSLWERFGFDLRPAFAAAAGMLACGLVVYGVATSDGAPDSTNGFGGYADASAGMGGVNHLLAPHSSSGNSTNPVADYGTPIDRKIFGGQILRTSFSAE